MREIKKRKRRKKGKLTRATSLSVLGVSSPGNLMIGDGRAFAAWKAINWTKNTLTTIRRQFKIVGKPIFLKLTQPSVQQIQLVPLSPQVHSLVFPLLLSAGLFFPLRTSYALLQSMNFLNCAHALFPPLSHRRFLRTIYCISYFSLRLIFKRLKEISKWEFYLNKPKKINNN